MLEPYKPFDLQLFAEGEGEGVNDGEAADLQYNVDNAEVQDTGASDTDTGSDGAADQNHVQSAEDNARFAAARREAEAQARALKERQDSFAKSRGFDSFEEMESYAQQQDLIDQGIDPATAQLQVQLNQIQQQMQQSSNMARIQQDKAKLQGQKYFKDLESDIDRMLAANPALDVGLTFEFLKGKKMEELIAKEAKAAQQRTLNNMNSKSHIKPDGKSAGNDFIDVDPDEFRIAKALNPKETIESYRAFKKSQRS